MNIRPPDMVIVYKLSKKKCMLILDNICLKRS